MLGIELRCSINRVCAVGLVTLLASGCGQSGASMQCAGKGSVRGSYQNTNDGALTFAFGVAWHSAGGGYRVIFTRDEKLADALRASPAPDSEVRRLGQLLGELLVGFDFHVDGKYQQHITEGSSTSSGWSEADVGSAQLDAEGCLRGDVTLDSYGNGHFALPLLAFSTTAPGTDTRVERDARPKTNIGLQRTEETQDPLVVWRQAFARLTQPHPATALQAVGFSASLASVLVGDKRVKPVLARFRGQCPDPTTASLNEYGEVVGPSRPKAGFVLNGTGVASLGPNGAVIDNCYVMQRNGQYIDQCWPLTTDCTLSPLYQPQ